MLAFNWKTSCSRFLHDFSICFWQSTSRAWSSFDLKVYMKKTLNIEKIFYKPTLCKCELCMWAIWFACWLINSALTALKLINIITSSNRFDALNFEIPTFVWMTQVFVAISILSLYLILSIYTLTRHFAQLWPRCF